MLKFHNSSELTDYLNSQRQHGLKIGFVPTMGALHEGHLSLIKASNSENDITVCSIFVNPTQFNNSVDLERYPRTLENDLRLLLENNCHVVFIPEVNDLYANEVAIDWNLNNLDQVFEGKSRPGHFNGVARVVSIFFNLVKPDVAYFGRKDFQQCMVISLLVSTLQLPIKLVFVPTLREPDGLAMSSRNVRLNAAQRKASAAIYRALLLANNQFGQSAIKELEEACRSTIENESELKVDYFSIVEAETLRPIINSRDARNPVALTAVWAGEVRLIDNMELGKEVNGLTG